MPKLCPWLAATLALVLSLPVPSRAQSDAASTPVGVETAAAGETTTAAGETTAAVGTPDPDATKDGVETIEVNGAVGQDPLPALLDAPVETEVISARRIESLPAKNLADVAAYLPGIRLQQRVQGQGAAASVEGLPPEYTKALVNGQHYAGELGGVGDLEDFPVTNASEVLVLRGPQAMRYGADAGGAVIDVKTFQPPFDDGWRARVDGGGGDQGQVYGSQVSAVRFGRFGATLSTIYDGIDGQKDRHSDAVITGIGNDSHADWQDAYGTLMWNANESFVLRSNLGWRKDSERVEGEDGLPDERRDTARWIQSGGFSASVDPQTDLEGEVYHFSSDMDSSIGRDFALTDEEWKVDFSVVRRFEIFGQEPSLRIGVDWRLPSLELNESDIATNTPDGGPTGNGHIDERVFATGVYAILETSLNDWTKFQVGAREQWQSRFQSAFVPQVALLVDPTSQLKLRASWGQSYRTPSLRDLYQPAVPNLGGAYYLAGNPDLKSESAIGYRLGFEYTPHENVWISSTFFSNKIDDFIRSTFAGEVLTGTQHEVLPDPYPSVCSLDPRLPQCLPILVDDKATLFRKTNVDLLRTRGMEAQVRGRPSQFVDLRVAYTFLTTHIDTPLLDLDELPNEPRHTVDLEMALRAPRLDTVLVTRARWRDRAWVEGSGTGSVSFTQLEKSDPSWVLDARLQQPIRDGLVVYLDLNNITNTDVVDSYEIRGRSFFVGVRLDLESLTRSSP